MQRMLAKEIIIIRQIDCARGGTLTTAPSNPIANPLRSSERFFMLNPPIVPHGTFLVVPSILIYSSNKDVSHFKEQETSFFVKMKCLVIKKISERSESLPVQARIHFF